MKNMLLPDVLCGTSRTKFVLRTVLAAATLAMILLPSGCRRPNDQTVLSGNVEVTDAQLGFKSPGRVAERLVSEGERVATGQLVARLDDAEQKQELALREAEFAAAQAMLAELEAGSRAQEIAAAEATLRSAEAERNRLKLDFARQQELRAQNVIPEREFEAAQAMLSVADARVAEVGERLKLVREGPRPEAILQARARVSQAKAAVGLAATRLDNTRLLAPLTGAVLSHNIEAGEYVSAGTPVITVADVLHTWVRVYVSQADLGRIHLGQKLQVRTDAYPDKTYEGVVGFISAEAEFTPKTVQTPKERVKLVYRVKVDVTNTADELKPGMPADVLLP